MQKISAGLFLIALTTLMLELTLIRTFDVIWYPNMAYMVITLAMFCFGLSGVYSTLWPYKDVEKVTGFLAILAILFGLFAVAILPALNYLPYDFKHFFRRPLYSAGFFLIMYLILAIPFFLSGLIFTTVFDSFAQRIQRLYFWDLCGAAIGCIILIPLLPVIGPGGILLIATGFCLIAAGLFSKNSKAMVALAAAGAITLAVPFILSPGTLEFRDHMEKRGVKSARARGKVEISYWDPISKIDVIDQAAGARKHIAYDGGTQSSYIFPFDGDLTALRDKLPQETGRNFTGQPVILSHFLKRDTDKEVLVIGSAGGQEMKAALVYGAARVDAVELVAYVVRLGKEIYADYNGGIFNHPKVNAMVGEGRSFLRSTDKTYDIIQIFSNHTSSSIAAGTGAMATTYLQTVEAYEEYFRHLKPDGILQINHHVYPKMVTTAAVAWRRIGLVDFQKHVAVFQAQGPIRDNLPTFLVKMSPWTPTQIDEAQKFFEGNIKMVEFPLEPERSFLSEDFYSGEFPPELERKMNYRAGPSTDNRPYFNFFRKKIEKFRVDEALFMNYSTAALLNSQLKNSIFPKDVTHLFVTGGASLIFAFIFIFVPLFFSSAGKINWPRKYSSLVYFACLGAGFIIIELVYIQIFMKLIGYPLYTYSSVVFALLLAAGLGSFFSQRMGIHTSTRFSLAFLGILITGGCLLVTHQAVFNYFLNFSTPIRIFVAMLLIIPQGFFMGMPFPLGILQVEKHPRGAIAWAWALNGLFTVIGGLFCVLFSIFIGFKQTLLIALGLYALAFYMYARMRSANAAG